MDLSELTNFQQALRRYLKTVPGEMGRAVVAESADNFRRQGAENEQGSVVPWAPRKAVANGVARGQRGPNPRQRAILIKSGRLRRSVRIVATTATTVTVGSSQVYAQAQQEGNGRGLKPRPFITMGRTAQQKLVKKIRAGITGLLK